MPNCRFSGCRCETGDLIKNGGVEVTSTEPGLPFQYWKEINPSFARVANEPVLTNIAYEKLAAARFEAPNILHWERSDRTCIKGRAVIQSGTL